MSAFLSGEPALERRTSLSTFIARARNESALGTVTHAVKASALGSLSSPATAGYGSMAVVGWTKRLTSGMDESTSICWNRERELRSMVWSVISKDVLP